MATGHDLNVDGTRVRLWERSPPDATEAVLFVHGATYPGRVVFDLDADGDSWLDATADAGRAAFAVDLRGYGDSERPPGMMADDPPPGDPPSRAETVTAEVRAALDCIGVRYDRVHLLGYSWGSVVCGRLLAGGDVPSVASLTQFAPVFRMDPDLVARFDPGDPAPAYRTLTRVEVGERWTGQIPDDADPDAWRGGPNVFDAFWTALRETGQADPDGTVRAPNGTLVDLRETVDSAPYAPERIDVPTLVVRGSADPTATRADACRLYDRLEAPREYAEVGGGTHFLPVEARRNVLYDLVGSFHDRA